MQTHDILNQTIDEYKKQNYTGAAELADVAYIDNFEFVEAPLEEKNEQLMEETEITLREDLSRLIEERAQPQQVQELINQINEQLDQAEQLLLST
jgi:high-affinity iron transporter